MIKIFRKHLTVIVNQIFKKMNIKNTSCLALCLFNAYFTDFGGITKISKLNDLLNGNNFVYTNLIMFKQSSDGLCRTLGWIDFR